ncbi:MAG TPA: SDR family oxidoreductase [Mycobacteriales bacterium]|jgi:hypothetical protein|nr:SDR family oxidoreductase [Mycobacteriales bacterium]
MPTALVTGATAGIGAAFARQLADRGYDLVLVARDGARLAAVADSLPVPVEVLAVDLATDEGCARIEWRLGEGVDLLVNNAGVGSPGAFDASDRGAEEHLLRLNVRAVLRLSHAALPPMLERGSGAIIHVSSMAGFVPGARGATYSASKAWVTNFSQSLHLQYAARGVRVLASCPGFTRTEFHERAQMDVSGVPAGMWLEADDVVAEALADLARGRSLSIPGARYKALLTASRVVPQGLQRRVVAAVRGRLPGRQGATA